MSSAAALLELVALANRGMNLAMELNLSWDRLVQYQRKARMEGREFGIEDVKRIRDEARQALDDLDRTIAEAESGPADS